MTTSKDTITVRLTREELEAVAVELGAIRGSESSFEMGRSPLAVYNAACDSLRAALDQPTPNQQEPFLSDEDRERAVELLRRVTQHPRKIHPGRPAVQYGSVWQEVADEVDAFLRSLANRPDQPEPKEPAVTDGEHEEWTGPADIAWCPEHGLHGARSTCFECGKPVKQIRMIPVAEVETAENPLAHFWPPVDVHAKSRPEPLQSGDCDDLCKCGHVRHEHHYFPDPEAGPETGRCAHCDCAAFELELPDSSKRQEGAG